MTLSASGRLVLAILAALLAVPALAAPIAEIVLDARDGSVLHVRNADTRLHPASLTKMMTLYLVFEAIGTGKIGLDQKVTISAHAARQPPSRIGLRPGQKVSVRDLIRAAAVKSANDAATALAEAVAGSEPAFAKMMTARAAALGMRNSRFVNANGLSRTGHYSSARDMALLGRRLFYDFPQFYNLFGREATPSLGRTIHTTNRLLSEYEGADGIKTGYTRDAGYNLVASAERGGKRVIAVLFGGRSSRTRNARVAELLDLGFGRAPIEIRFVPPNPLLDPSVPVSAPPRPRGTLPENLPETFIEASVRTIGAAIVPAAAAAEPPAVTLLAEAGPAPVTAERPRTRPPVPARVWSVELGAYREKGSAQRTLSRVAALKVPALRGAERQIEPKVVRGVHLWSALLTGLSRKSAEAVCAKLPDPCRLVRTGDG